MGRGRRRVEVRRIENTVSRQVTFSKRRRGLAKKARELAVLCDADVALLVFSDKGRLHDSAAHASIYHPGGTKHGASVDQILDRYERYLLSEAGVVMEEHPELQENMSHDNIMLRSKIEALQKSQRNLMGEQLDTLTLREVQQLQQQIEIALRNIRSRKDSILLNSIRELQKKEKMLTEQNNTLKKEMAGLASGSSQHKDRTVSSTKSAPLPNLNTFFSTDGSDDLGPVMPPPEVASGSDLPWWMLQPWSAED